MLHYLGPARGKILGLILDKIRGRIDQISPRPPRVLFFSSIRTVLQKVAWVLRNSDMWWSKRVE